MFHDARLPDRFKSLKSNARLLLQEQEELISHLPVEITCIYCNYVVIVVAGYWVTKELCKNINFLMETKEKKKTVFRHIKDRLNRLSLGQISKFVRSRKDSYCNVKLKWPDTGQHT